MSEFGGPESLSPDEGSGGAREQVQEKSSQAFAGIGQALQQIYVDEKRAKKRDDGVAQAIMQFLSDEQKAHFATLIARLVALNCPSPFILSLLGLISDPCAAAVAEYLKEKSDESDGRFAETLALITQSTSLDTDTHRRMLTWVSHIDHVLATDSRRILDTILVEERNIDGTVLQLTSFVLQDYFQSLKKDTAFEKMQPLAIGILQTVFSPHLKQRMENKLAEAGEE